jgi:hypothetical protein
MMHPKKTYLVEDLFEDIPGDPDNVILKIPPEICEAQGWVEGTTLDITAQEGMLTLKTHVE